MSNIFSLLKYDKVSSLIPLLDNASLVPKQYVDTEIQNAISGFGRFRGDLNASTGVPTSIDIIAGDFWRVTVAGTISGVTPNANLEVGDVLIARVDNATLGGDFFAIQANFSTSADITVGGTFAPLAGTVTGTDNVKVALEKIQGNLTNSILTAGSGINIASGAIRLGGDITATTSLTGNHFFTIQTRTVDLRTFSNGRVSLRGFNDDAIPVDGIVVGNAPTQIKAIDNSGFNSTSIALYQNGMIFNSRSFIFNNRNIGNGHSDGFGIRYMGFNEASLTDQTGVDYSTLTFNSLVPKKYVDDATSSLATGQDGEGISFSGGRFNIGGGLVVDANRQVVIGEGSPSLAFNKINGTGVLRLNLTSGGNGDFTTSGSSANVSTGVNLFSDGTGRIQANDSTSGFNNLLTLTPTADNPFVFSSTNPNFQGVQYGADYSANFTLRSLVDKEYVDDAIDAAAIQVENGITLTAGVARLGGNLTQNTTIDADFLNFSIIGANFLGLTARSGITIATIDNGGAITFETFNGQIEFRSFAANTNIDAATINLTTTVGGVVITGDEHAKYAADYSTNYTNRSLVDKEYVDTQVGATKFKATIVGNGTDLTYTVTHNLNTLDVIVQVYDLVSADAPTVFVTTTRNSVNTVVLNFSVAPLVTEEYRVLVQAI